MRRRLLIICAISALSFFSGLGRGAISESDEAFYAEAGREMIESGDWLTPHFNYEPRFQKPILFYWIVAASYRIAGVSEAAARFGSALSGVGLALLTFVTARRMFNEGVAFASAAIVATNYGYVAMAHLSLPDLPLTLFITLTVALGFRALDRPDAIAPLVGAAAAAGLGTLTKGPLGIVLPVLVLVPVAALERRWTALTPRRLALALVVCTVITVPWYAAMTRTHGAEYLQGFLVGDNVERFTTTRYNDPRAPWYYVPIVAGGLLPWTPFAALLAGPASAWMRRRRPMSEEERRLVVWMLLPFLFFTVSIGKQARYILPVLPPLAMLIAHAIDRRIGGSAKLRERGVRLAGFGSALIMLWVAITMWRLRPLIAYGTPDTTTTIAALCTGAAGIATMLVAARLGPAALIPTLLAASAVTLTSLQYGVFTTRGPEPVEVAAGIIKAERRAREDVVVYNALDRNLVFYTHIPQSRFPDEEEIRRRFAERDRILCVLPARSVKQLEQSGVGVVRLGELRYFDAASMKLKTVFAPDLEHDLTSIVVVANK